MCEDMRKMINETMKFASKSIGSKPSCNNVLCFSRMLQRRKFVVKDDFFNVKILIKGDGDELERAFDIEVPYLTNLKQYYNSNSEYKGAVEDYENNEVSVVGWNLYGEESESREIFYSEIEEVIQDLNK